MFYRLAAILTAALMLGACAVDPNVSYGSHLPDFIKQPAPASHAAEAVPPDVPAILRANINSVFVSTSAPTNIRYSLPVASKRGNWETCVRADLTGATGKPLGERTYLVGIYDNQIGDRQLMSANGRCSQETYRPL
jgi:hypothetical protein